MTYHKIHPFFNRKQVARLVLGIDRVDPIVLLPATETMSDRIARLFATREKMGLITRLYLGQDLVSLCCSGIGSPSTEIMVHGLIAGGAQIILRFDVCGSLTEKIQVGHIFVAEQAYSFDGVSSCYVPVQSISASQPLVSAFRQVVKMDRSEEVVLNQGRIATVDFFFAQRMEHHHKWAEVASAVDMETAALYSICQVAAVEALSVMVVSDLKLSGHDPFLGQGFDGKSMKKGLSMMGKLIIPMVQYLLSEYRSGR